MPIILKVWNTDRLIELNLYKYLLYVDKFRFEVLQYEYNKVVADLQIGQQ